VPPVPPWFRLLAYVMAALLAVCVALQHNDPDPGRWMAIYGAGALLSIALPARRLAAAPAALLGLASLAWAAYLVHRTWGAIELADLTGKMSEKGGTVEEGREAGGLAIQGAWLAIGAALRRRWR
jgi:hypothetical protein